MMQGLKTALQTVLIAVFLAGSLLGQKIYAQDVSFPPADSLSEVTRLDIHSPKTALLRSLILPGWGQVYNKDYYKLPFVYAALGGITATAIVLNIQYKTYQEAYLFAVWYNEETDLSTFDNYRSSYTELGLDVSQSIANANSIRTARNNLRRNRDLSFIGIGLVYGLVVLDAYVSAHLFDFDVSEQLSMEIVPTPAGGFFAIRYKW